MGYGGIWVPWRGFTGRPKMGEKRWSIPVDEGLPFMWSAEIHLRVASHGCCVLFQRSLAEMEDVNIIWASADGQRLTVCVDVFENVRDETKPITEMSYCAAAELPFPASEVVESLNLIFREIVQKYRSLHEVTNPVCYQGVNVERLRNNLGKASASLPADGRGS